MIAFGANLWIFYGAALFMGIGKGIIGPAPAAYAGDLAPPGKSGVTMGLYRTFGDLGFIAGPMLLGLIADAYQGRFAGISSAGIAIELNAALLIISASALMLFARETAGHQQFS